MKEIVSKTKTGRGQSVLKERVLRFFRTDLGSSTRILGNTEAHKSLQHELTTAMLSADQARANALMEWQKNRRISQTL